MRRELVLDLAGCTEFRQTLQARPPRIVHGTTVLLATLLSVALIWSALTQADLVVRVPGRVRPVVSTMKVLNTGRGEVLSASTGGRVVEVNYREGDAVRQGDVLIRLDTQRLDNEIAQRQRTIQTAEEELDKLARLEELQARQYEASRLKAETEVAQGEEELRQSQQRHESDIRIARLQLDQARRDETRLQSLVQRKIATPAELEKATAQLGEATEKLAKAELPVDHRRVEVLRQAVAVGEQDYALKREELELKRSTKQGEAAAARIELTILELERRQADLCAPIDGLVTSGDVKVGDVLEWGKAVLEIAPQQGFFFEATVPSEEVGHLQVGMPARIKLDAYDYQRYGTLAGKVVFLSADSVVPEGKQAAHYIVRIDLEGEEVGRGEFRGQVKLGMAGQVEIITDHESILAILVKKIRQTISLG